MVLIMKFRETFLGLGLSSGTLLAHSVAGGSRITGLQFVTVMATMFLIGFLLSGIAMEGPVLASAIVISQLLGHFLLSDTNATSNWMLASHTILGLATYLLLTYADILINWLGLTTFKVFSVFTIPVLSSITLFELFVNGFRNSFRELARNWSPAPPRLSF